MHPNPQFRQSDTPEDLAWAASRGFGVLTAAGANGPVAAHVPFVLAGGAVEAHLARSSPLARALGDGLSALLIVSGPDGYVSPDWYGMPDQVPTWNYVAVHIRGPLSWLPDTALEPHLRRVSAAFEARLPKAPWTPDKMSDGVMARMMRAIRPVRLIPERIDATWKLGQNKPAAARAGAAAAIEGGLGNELAALSALMRAQAGT